MNGNIMTLKDNSLGVKTYGFIFGEDGKDYFFIRTV